MGLKGLMYLWMLVQTVPKNCLLLYSKKPWSWQFIIFTWKWRDKGWEFYLPFPIKGGPIPSFTLGKSPASEESNSFCWHWSDILSIIVHHLLCNVETSERIVGLKLCICCGIFSAGMVLGKVFWNGKLMLSKLSLIINMNVVNFIKVHILKCDANWQ